MAIEIGQKISPELRDYITRLTTPEFRTDIYINKYRLTDNYCRETLNGNKAVTESTKPMIEDLIKEAISNRKPILDGLNKTHRKLITK